MPEPVTAGVLVASALSAGATTLVNGALGEAAKDAYSAVKKAVLRWAGHEVEALEAKPGSLVREAVIAEFINEQPADTQAQLAGLARALVTTLYAEAKERGPIGVEIGRLEALEVRLGEIVARAGTGFKAEEVKTPGTFTINKICTRGGGPAADTSAPDDAPIRAYINTLNLGISVEQVLRFVELARSPEAAAHEELARRLDDLAPPDARITREVLDCIFHILRAVPITPKRL